MYTRTPERYTGKEKRTHAEVGVSQTSKDKRIYLIPNDKITHLEIKIQFFVHKGPTGFDTYTFPRKKYINCCSAKLTPKREFETHPKRTINIKSINRLSISINFEFFLSFRLNLKQQQFQQPITLNEPRQIRYHVSLWLICYVFHFVCLNVRGFCCLFVRFRFCHLSNHAFFGTQKLLNAT